MGLARQHQSSGKANKRRRQVPSPAKMNSDLSSGEPVGVAEERRLSDLPDEILILIFNRILDLKCLCLCSLVSPRFSSLILLHVHSISFAVPRRTTTNPLSTPPPNTSSNKLLRFVIDSVVTKPFQYFRQFVFAAGRKPLPSMISSFYGDSFRSAVYFLSKLKSIHSFQLILPSSSHNPNPNNNVSLLFKWTAKFGPTIDTFVFLSASSIRPANVYDDEPEPEQADENELLKHRVHLAFQCLKDAIVRHRMLLFFIKEHPLLRNITITDSENQGNLSSRDSKLVEIRNWINSLSLEMKSELKKIEVPVSAQQWHVPVLVLPLSGKVMTSATLVLMEMVDRRHQRRDWDSDAATISGLFDKEEEEYAEAVVEMMVNCQSRMKILL